MSSTVVRWDGIAPPILEFATYESALYFSLTVSTIFGKADTEPLDHYLEKKILYRIMPQWFGFSTPSSQQNGDPMKRLTMCGTTVSALKSSAAWYAQVRGFVARVVSSL
jgi:hypothetical protein